ncbi:MAG: bifunctional glutamate N-acetyltransferase/amino-acid acetyltransferase ArgJ [Pseudomonadales bacterium]|nr:bifunctional glutamate N-acetyltransferase/amino-acid acetyltransferase ArgJ [Pseudomonadales bacterium]
MAVGQPNFQFHKVAGVRLAAISCGIKPDGAVDLVLFELAAGSNTVGVFTQSLFAAAPVEIGKQHLAAASTRYMLINSGNANAGVGAQGLVDAIETCRALAKLAGTQPETVLPFSTGVIGEKLPVEKISGGLTSLLAGLSENNWPAAAKGIMTTDTRPKIATRQLNIAGKTVTLTGIAKGAGMIQPNMATLLCYITTDVKAEVATLNVMLADAMNHSFNRITVDSDTSTNDSCMLTATGQSGVDIDLDAADRESFKLVLQDICAELAQGIVRDAEGATKFIAVNVVGGRSEQECLAIAFSVANSPLLKTAMYASDANWGRIVMAIGKAEVQIDINRLDIYVGDVQLMDQGQKHCDYTETAGAEAVSGEEISITIDLNLGAVRETVWTCDLSHEYIRINAEYRT